MYRDDLKVLWCHSHLVFVVLEVSVPTHVLAFVQKTFNCDFIFTYHGSPRPWPIPLNFLPEYIKPHPLCSTPCLTKTFN